MSPTSQTTPVPTRVIQTQLPTPPDSGALVPAIEESQPGPAVEAPPAVKAGPPAKKKEARPDSKMKGAELDSKKKVAEPDSKKKAAKVVLIQRGARLYDEYTSVKEEPRHK